MAVVPAVFGSGRRCLGPVDGQHLLEDPDVVLRGTASCTCGTGCAADSGPGGQLRGQAS